MDMLNQITQAYLQQRMAPKKAEEKAPEKEEKPFDPARVRALLNSPKDPKPAPRGGVKVPPGGLHNEALAPAMPSTGLMVA